MSVTYPAGSYEVTNSDINFIEALVNTTYNKLGKKEVINQTIEASTFLNVFFNLNEMKMGNVKRNTMVGCNSQNPVEFLLEVEDNTNIKKYKYLEPLDAAPQGSVKKSVFEFDNIGATFPVSYEELRKANTDEAKVKIVTRLLENMKKSLKKRLSRAFLDERTSGTGYIASGDRITKAVSDLLKTSGTVGNIDVTTQNSEGIYYMKPQTGSSSDYNTDGYKTIRTVKNDCAEGDEQVDLMFATQNLFEAYEDECRSYGYVNLSGTAQKLADLGIETLQFGNAPFVYDKNFLIDSASTTGKVYLLNTNTMKVYYDKMTWFKMLPMEKLDATVQGWIKTILLSLTLAVEKPSLCGYVDVTI